MALAWFLLSAGLILVLAYRRASRASAAAALAALLLAYWVFGAAPDWWKGVVSIPVALLLLLNVRPLRMSLLTRPFLRG